MKKLILLLTQLFCHHKYQYTEINHDGLNTMECKWCGKKKVVKVLSLLALAFVMCGCVYRQYVTDFGIVEGVEINNDAFSSQGKYIVTISSDFNAHWLYKAYLYTDELYSIGDTIQVTRRTNP